MNFYTVHNENGTLALPLTPSLCLPPFAMGGNDKLELWKGKKIKSFIVQYDHLYPCVYGGDGDDDCNINNNALIGFFLSRLSCNDPAPSSNKVRVETLNAVVLFINQFEHHNPVKAESPLDHSEVQRALSLRTCVWV